MSRGVPDELDPVTAAKGREATRRAAAVEATALVRRLAEQLAGSEQDSLLVDDTPLSGGPDSTVTGYRCGVAGMEEFLALPECTVCGGSGKRPPNGFWCRPTEKPVRGDSAGG